jgi:serine/threonine protein kinase
VVHASVAGLQPFAVQLLREACLLEALPHPGVPRVYETGLLADRRPWFAVEPFDGVALAARFGRGPLPAAEIAWLVRDLSVILEHAHRRGIVHRALRPEVVVLDARGVHVVDWSDARAHDAPRAPHAPAQGSRPYVAPELVMGDVADDRADVYALGAIAYRALTGALPCAHPAIAERGALARLVEQMLARAPFDRPSSTEVRAELDAMEVPQNAAPVAVDVERSSPRIRKPRWTPAFATVVPTGEVGAPPIDGLSRKH